MKNLSKLEQAFWNFHNANGHVYTMLCTLARRWMSVHGKGKLGIGMLFERARWEIAMTTHSTDGFKLNNNHRAFYARLIMDNEPDLAEAFALRQQCIQATCGPLNITLSSGGHVT